MGDKPQYVAFSTPLGFRAHVVLFQPRWNAPVVNRKKKWVGESAYCLEAGDKQWIAFLTLSKLWGQIVGTRQGPQG